MKVLIITACTALKMHNPPNQLTWDDFVSPDRLPERTRELSDFRALAAEMYTGPHHQHLMDGVKAVRNSDGPDVVDLHIISAGYGLLGEAEIIVPYNVTFNNVSTGELLNRSTHLQIHEDVKSLISDYGLVFFLLSQKYVRALQPLPFDAPDTVTQIFLAAPSWQRLIPDHLPNVHIVLAGPELVAQFEGATRYNLKGFVFKKFCKTACGQAHRVFEEVRQSPQRMIEMVLDCNRGR